MPKQAMPPTRAIAIETPAGRAEYVRIQQQVADRAAPLRERLAQRCEALLMTVDQESATPVAREKAAAVSAGIAAITRG